LQSYAFSSETFAKLVALRQGSPNLKILLSVGGWMLTQQLVSMSATAAGRKMFIDSAISNLRTWRLDGLDIDWEFPYAADRLTFSTLLTVSYFFTLKNVYFSTN
jgi:chitinase